MTTTADTRATLIDRDLAQQAMSRIRWLGPALPFTRGAEGYWTPQELVRLLPSSIYAILTTPVETRLWRPDFGSNLSHLVFEPNDQVLAAEVRFYTVEALRKWEPRIEIIAVSTVAYEHEFKVQITYRILATQVQVMDIIALPRQERVTGLLNT